MKSNYFFTLLALLFFSSAFAQTTVPALITSNQTWDITGSPYLITQNTYIDTGVSVIVKPGAIVNFTGNYKLSVDGEFQAVGKVDSVINITNAQISLSAKSIGYNDTTMRGAFFQYCDITGAGTAMQTINMSTSGIRIDHCNFTKGYYALYITNSSIPAKVIVTNSDFSGDSTNYGYPIYMSTGNVEIIITNNHFHDAYYLNLYGTITFQNNVSENLKAVNYTFNGDASITCNTFKNMSNGIQLNVSAYGIAVAIDFSNNTLDSLGTSNYNPMLQLNRYSPSYAMRSFTANHNNFLTNTSTIEKLRIVGSNPDPKTSDTLDFTNNYWGSTQPSVIATYIKDYTDDIVVFATADFSNYLTTPDTTCNLNGPCGTANFTYTSQGQTLSFSNTSNAPNGSIYEWHFGDGTSNTINNNTVSHQYTSAGTYVACLILFDANGNFCDTRCDTISVAASSTCNASFYYGTDTANVYNLYVINNSTGTSSSTQYAWSFGDGNSSATQHPTHTYNAFGLYQLCLTLSDSSSGCSSTYCDSVGLDSNGIMLKRDGFTITVLDEKDLLSTPIFNLNADVKVYPNPSTGLVNIKIVTQEKGMLTAKVISSIGQLLMANENNITASSQIIPLDLSELPNGIYYLKLELNGKTKMDRIILNK